MVKYGWFWFGGTRRRIVEVISIPYSRVTITLQACHSRRVHASDLDTNMIEIINYSPNYSEMQFVEYEEQIIFNKFVSMYH